MAHAALISNRFTPYSLSEQIGHRVPAVVSVYAKQNGDLVSVWTAVDDFDRRVRDMIYDAEERLMEQYPQVTFDFHVIRAHSSREVSSAVVAYSR